MTTIYQYLNTLTGSYLKGGIHLADPKDTPNLAYAIVDEGLDSAQLTFHTGGRLVGEPSGTSTFMMTISLFGRSGADFIELVPTYQKIKQEVTTAITDHPGLAFAGLEIAQGCVRPSYNETVDRAYGAIRLNITYYE